MRLVRLAMLVGILIAMVGSAQGIPLVLQNGLDGYMGCEDNCWDNWSSATEVRNYGGYDFLRYYGSDARRKIVIRFNDLDTLIPVPSGSVISAKLALRQYKSEYPNNSHTDNVAFYKMTHDWVEGTTDRPYITQDGCSYQYYAGTRHVAGAWTYHAPGTVIDGTAVPAGTDIWSYQVGAGVTVDKGMYDMEWSSSSWDMKATSAALMTDTTSCYQSGTTVYVNHAEATAATNPDNTAHKFCYFEDVDKWPGGVGAQADRDPTPIYASWEDLIWDYAGYAGSDLASYEGESDFQEVDITAWVQEWMDNPGSNYGVMISRGTGGTNGRFFFASEIDEFYVANRKCYGEYNYNQGGVLPTALDLTYGPKLIIEYELPPVPEPAGLGLVGMALMALRRRRG